jgi:hypothetical protein
MVGIGMYLIHLPLYVKVVQNGYVRDDMFEVD